MLLLFKILMIKSHLQSTLIKPSKFTVILSEGPASCCSIGFFFPALNCSISVICLFDILKKIFKPTNDKKDRNKKYSNISNLRKKRHCQIKNTSSAARWTHYPSSVMVKMNLFLQGHYLGYVEVEICIT